jgi:hypothetical protein
VTTKSRTIFALVSLSLVIVFFALCQILVPTTLTGRVKKDVFRYVPATQRSSVHITTSPPVPAALVLLGNLGNIEVKASELRVPISTTFFSLINEASHLEIHARILALHQISLQDVSLHSSEGNFSFQGFVSGEAIKAATPFTPIIGRITGDGIPFSTFNRSLALSFLIKENGKKIAAGVTSNGKEVPPSFTVLEDPAMHISSIQIKPYQAGWWIVVHGNAR